MVFDKSCGITGWAEQLISVPHYSVVTDLILQASFPDVILGLPTHNSPLSTSLPDVILGLPTHNSPLSTSLPHVILGLPTHISPLSTCSIHVILRLPIHILPTVNGVCKAQNLVHRHYFKRARTHTHTHVHTHARTHARTHIYSERERERAVQVEAVYTRSLDTVHKP